MMILVVLFAAVVCVLIVIAVIAVKTAIFLVGILLVTLAIALVVAPLIAAAALLIHFGRAPAASKLARQFRTYRLSILASAFAGWAFIDAVWFRYHLHWSHFPLLSYLLIALTVGGVLISLQDRVEPWRETRCIPVDGA